MALLPRISADFDAKLVEIVLDKLDAPEATRKIGKAIEQFNKSA